MGAHENTPHENTPKMPLTDTAVRQAKPGSKPRKLSDEKGVFLLVNTDGRRYWRLKYRFGGKEKLLALRVYPEVSLKEARERRDEARRLLAAGRDPSAERKAARLLEGTQAERRQATLSSMWRALTLPGKRPGGPRGTQ